MTPSNPCLTAALTYAARGWPVIQLGPRKIPRGSCAECKPTDGPRCTGPAMCGHDQCHGSLDATTDPCRIEKWWTSRPDGGVAIVVPVGLIVVDADPRHAVPGDVLLAMLEARHGVLPATLGVLSGRGDGGSHAYLSVPADIERTLSVFGHTGLDIKTPGSYCVAPPTLHPATGVAYAWSRIAPIAPAPQWLIGMIRKRASEPAARSGWVASANRGVTIGGDPFATNGGTIADYNRTAGFHDVLAEHGWALISGDGNEDGSRWRHPAASTPISATVSGGRLYVYSNNTAFEVTTPGDQHGYDPFDVYMTLAHGGDHGAALDHIRSGK